MTQHRLGRAEEARAALARLRQARGPQADTFLREAEALLAPAGD